MTPQEKLLYLLETVETPNPEGWTIKKVINATNEQVGGKLEVSLDVMADNRVPFTRTTLYALSQEAGLSIHDEASQRLIDSIATYSQLLPEELRWDAEFVDIIKSLGVTKQPRWQTQGYATEPTLESVTEELRLAEVTEWTETKIQQVNAAMRLAAAVEGATVDDVRAAAIGELQ